VPCGVCAREEHHAGSLQAHHGDVRQRFFRPYCAVCHGQDGKGGGPAASALKTGPADLTEIGRQNNGKVPEQRVLATFKGEGGVTAHGSPDMPIWGTIFTSMSSNLNKSQGRIYALLNYVEEIQVK
jgi:hypothetical protein